MKRDSKSQHTSEIINRHLGSASEAARAVLLKTNPRSMARSVRRKREMQNFIIKDPKSLVDIDVERLSELKDKAGEKMLFHDSGMVNGMRFLIFAPPRNIQRLTTCGVSLMDATYDVCSLFFIPYYTIFLDSPSKIWTIVNTARIDRP